MIDTLSIINLCVCGLGVFICICRMGLMRGSVTKACFRYQYITWAMLLLCSGSSYLYHQPATPIQLALGTGILAHFALGYLAWREGPPTYTVCKKIVPEKRVSAAHTVQKYRFWVTK